jgi:hypothetical protein
MQRNDRLLSRARASERPESGGIPGQIGGFKGVDKVKALKGSEGGKEIAEDSTARVGQEQQDAVQYRDEYGFRMTDDQYKGYKGQETAWDRSLTGFSNQLSGYQGQINSARNALSSEKANKERDIAAAEARLDAASKIKLAELYRKERAGWQSVRLVDKNKVLANYRIPKSGVSQITKMKVAQGYVDGGAHYNIETHGRGDIRDNLASMLGTVERDVHTAWTNKALPGYNQAKSQIRAGYSQLNAARQNLINSYNNQLSELYTNETAVKGKQAEVGRARSEHSSRLSGYKKEYETKRAKRKALFGVT